MAKQVLVVTDASGKLHINPIGNKAYYQGRNNAAKKELYKLQELDEEKAAQFVAAHEGMDPTWKAPKESAKVIAEQTAALGDLQSKNADLEAQLAALRAQLEQQHEAGAKKATKENK